MLRNLEADPNYYDEYVSLFVNKSGDFVPITIEMVLRFFNIPLPSREIKINVNRINHHFDVIIKTNNTEILDELRTSLDCILTDIKNNVPFVPKQVGYMAKDELRKYEQMKSYKYLIDKIIGSIAVRDYKVDDPIVFY